VALKIEPTTSCMLGKYLATELHFQLPRPQLLEVHTIFQHHQSGDQSSNTQIFGEQTTTKPNHSRPHITSNK
jgi:hypothetical protein